MTLSPRHYWKIVGLVAAGVALIGYCSIHLVRLSYYDFILDVKSYARAYRCIHGAWPNSIRVLENALEKKKGAALEQRRLRLHLVITLASGGQHDQLAIGIRAWNLPAQVEECDLADGCTVVADSIVTDVGPPPSLVAARLAKPLLEKLSVLFRARAGRWATSANELLGSFPNEMRTVPSVRGTPATTLDATNVTIVESRRLSGAPSAKVEEGCYYYVDVFGWRYDLSCDYPSAP